jgi:hypothetical protein
MAAAGRLEGGAVDRLMFVNERGEERFSVPYPALRKRLFANRHFNFMRGELEQLLHERFTGRAAIRSILPSPL